MLTSGQEELLIVGQVIDKNDKQALYNASVYFNNSQVGTGTNKEGYFVLRTHTPQTHLVVSMMGYKTKIIKLAAGKSGAYNIELSEDTKVLPELIVFPGSNPAIEFMQQVRAAKQSNNPLLFKEYTPTVQEKTTAAISQVNSKSLNKKLFKQLQKGLLTTQDSSYFLPVYLSEDNYRLHKGQKTILHNYQKSILLSENNSLKELANKLPIEVNFYDNYISLFGKNFLSPLAETADYAYNYYLKDSISSSSNKEYIVVFQPKNKKELAFQGIMHIDSASLALTNITANLSNTANINFIQKLGFTQSFSSYNNKWLFKNQYTVVNLHASKTENTNGSFFITKTANFSFSDSTIATLNISPNQQDSFSVALDSLKNSRPIKVANAVADMLINKYIHTGVIDWGPINLLSSYNSVEGYRFTLGARTGKKLCENFTVGGYVGYGITDEKWKYGGEIRYRFKKTDYAVVGINYNNNMYQTDFDYHDQIRHENYVGNGLGDISTLLFQQYNTIYNQRKNAEVYFDKQLLKGVNTHFALATNRYLPNLLVPFQQATTNIPFIQDYTFTLGVRLSYKQRILDEFFHRIFLSNFYPTTQLVVQAGNYHTTLTSNYYLKLHASTKQTILLGNVGKFRYLLEAGTILGQVPYPLLEIYNGYENNGLNRYAFHPSYSTQYATDSYVNLHSNIVFNGLLFNHIPLINALNLRETAGIKVAYGTLQTKNRTAMDLPAYIQALNNPYIQLSAGIANIFKILALEYCWDFLPTKSPNVNWGIQARLYVDF
ncbi:MAG: carboxypeptidase-like regulatory domain-containing protein [Paludibacteraceae bacterium]|nr:carboxypeptidase-like regulatory domain-containing protein [Paludibacteraceae bacterium]